MDIIIHPHNDTHNITLCVFLDLISINMYNLYSFGNKMNTKILKIHITFYLLHFKFNILFIKLKFLKSHIENKIAILTTHETKTEIFVFGFLL